MSRIEPVRSSRASTRPRPPSRCRRRRARPRRACAGTRPELAPSSRITAGISGGSSGTMSHRTWQIENVSTVPVGLDLGPPVGGPEAAFAELPRRDEGAFALRARGGDDAPVPHAFEERAHRLAGVPLVASGRGARRRRRSRCGTASSDERRRARARAAGCPARVAVVARPAVGAHHDDRAHLHQVAPRLRHPALGRAGDLAGAGLAAQLPEELGDLHQAGRGDRVADAQQPAAGTARAGPRRAR